MVARSKSKPSTSAEGSMKEHSSSSYIFSNSASSQQQCPSLQVQKNQKVQQELFPSSFSIQRTSLSFHLVNLVLLSIVLLLIQSPSVVQSKSIALVSLQQQQRQQQDGTHGAQDSGLQLTEEESVHERRKRGTHDPILWPNNTIPFVFQEPFPRRYKTQVMNAMGVWQKRTCIKFVDRTDEVYFARIAVSPFVCRSLVGMRTQVEDRNVGQPVHLTVACLKKRGLVMHELGHLIGLHHEHQRPDRDDYIKFFPANVPKWAVGEFQVLDFTTYGKYDFDSIMHYPLTAFSLPGSPSMAVREGVTVPEGVVIGERHSLSRSDRKRVDKIYKCEKTDDANTTQTTPAVSSDNIYTGEQVHLEINGTNFTGSQWLSCTQDGCVVGTCPGKYFRTGDLTSCPNYVFTLYKVIPGNETSSKVVRVGDHIVLEYLPKSLIPDEHGHIMGDKRRLFVSCNPTTQVCALSSTCVTEANRYNDSYCRENVLIVRAEGKKVGDAITHRDLIGFEFEAVHNDPLVEEQCAFGCDAATKVCSKKRCIFYNSNSLSPNSLGGSAPEEHPQCGKDMFHIKKF